MKGDFTRTTFRPANHYSSVRMQQGRVQLDADWNEQLDIAGHRTSTEAIDVIGACGAPKHQPGFGVVVAPATLDASEQARVAALGLTPLPAGDFLLTPGRFYAGGTQCEIDEFVSFTRQPDLRDVQPIQDAGTYLVYLDVWQRHLTALDDEGIRETALGGPDTATRTKTIWQVKTAKVDLAKCIHDQAEWEKIVQFSTGRLAARAKPGKESDNPCILAPGAGYRRLENQLYRVEIHQPGSLGTATFKWSRDNGTVVTRLAGPINGKEVKVESLGRDAVLGFNNGDWVELSDDTTELNGVFGELVQIDTVDPTTRNVVFKTAPSFVFVKERNPKMRRWDDPGGERKVEMGAPTDDGFLELEAGVQVKFAAGHYNTGDYWLIPARTAPNNVDWPRDPASNDPLEQAPVGIAHDYCCLAVLAAQLDAETIKLTLTQDCRDIFPPLTEIEDPEDAHKRHNRYLHGWGVVCGLQVHCGDKKRQAVQIEPGYALECDGSEVILPAPGRLFPVVDAARKAGLLKDNTGKACITLATDEQKQIDFSVRAPGEDAKQSILQKILEGTLLMDVYRDCLDPVVKFARQQLLDEDPKDKRLVNTTVRRRIAALNLLVQFLNRSQADHIFLSQTEHDFLQQLHDDLKKFLKDDVFCGLLDGLPAFPDYPFKDANVQTGFGKAPMTRLRVGPGARVAYAFGGTGPAKVYVFELARGEMTAEIELPAVVGISTPEVRDMAIYDQGKSMLVAGTSGGNSVLYRFKITKEGLTYEPAGEPVVLGERTLLRLGQLAGDTSGMYGLMQGAGLVRFNPDGFDVASFSPIASFNATGEWVLGEGTFASLVFATATSANAGKTDRYSQIVVVQARGEEAAIVRTLNLSDTGTDGLAVLPAVQAPTDVTGAAVVGGRIYVVVDAKAGATGKRLLALEPSKGDTVADIPLGTTGPVHLAPSADFRLLLVSLAELYQMNWIDPAKNELKAPQVFPAQMYPMSVAATPLVLRRRAVVSRATGQSPLILVANRDSQTLSLIPAGLIAAEPVVSLQAVRDYRASLLAVYRELGVRLLQQIKDCVCGHLLRDCPTCGEDDVIELACVDIRDGKVYAICNFHRREVITFPKLFYWLSAIPIIPAIHYLVERFCCLLLPDLFKPRAAATGDLVAVSSFAPLRAKFTAENARLAQADFKTSVTQLSRSLWTATKVQAVAPPKATTGVRLQEVVNDDPENVKRRLAERGVTVNEVTTFDSAFAANPWQTVGEQKLTFKPGDQVNLLVKNGRVAMVTGAASARKAAGAGGTTDALVDRDISQLKARLARMEDSHAAYLATRERELAEVKSKLTALQGQLRTARKSSDRPKK